MEGTRRPRPPPVEPTVYPCPNNVPAPDEKAERAKAAGCTYPIVYTREDFVARVMEISNGRKLSVVFDSVGRDTFAKSLDCLRRRGTMVVFGQSSGTIDPIEINLLARKGSLVLTRPMLPDFIIDNASRDAVSSDLYEAVASGTLKAPVGQTFSLREAAAAHRAIEGRKTTGSTVLIL